MDKFVRFEMGDRLVCIKEYKTIKVGSHYGIKGCGPLEYNADPEVNGRKEIGRASCRERV
jgi:hypothetical protein